MAEIRVKAEGTLRWVQASGSGLAWATASAPVSGLFAYVTDFNWTSASTIIQAIDRGVVTHHKETTKQAIQVNFTVQYAATADLPKPTSGSGASVPMVHLEFYMKRPEISLSPGSGIYYQFHGVPINSLNFTEGDPSTVAHTVMALAMNGPTASGFLS